MRNNFLNVLVGKSGGKKSRQTSITRTPIIQIVCPLMDSDKWNSTE